MKKLNFGKVVAAIRSLFAKKNLEWNLAQSHKSFDTSNLDLRRDMSVIQR
jgi:hypothetical protein